MSFTGVTPLPVFDLDSEACFKGTRGTGIEGSGGDDESGFPMRRIRGFLVGFGGTGLAGLVICDGGTFWESTGLGERLGDGLELSACCSDFFAASEACCWACCCLRILSTVA